MSRWVGPFEELHNYAAAAGARHVHASAVELLTAFKTANPAQAEAVDQMIAELTEKANRTSLRVQYSRELLGRVNGRFIYPAAKADQI